MAGAGRLAVHTFRRGCLVALAIAPALAFGSGVRADRRCEEFEHAKAAIRAGDLAAAQRSLEACVSAAPGDADAWRTLGMVRFAQQRLEPAAAALERSLALAPAQPQALRMLGRVHTARGQPALAERAFVEAARLDPRDAEARYLLGRLYQSQDRLVEAARFLKDATDLDPASARAYAFLGSVAYALGDDGLARASLETAVGLEARATARDAIPHLEYGIYLQREDRLEQSVAELRQAARLDASSVEARFELAQSLRRLGRRTEAAAALREALALDAGDPRIHHLLGRICYEQGDTTCGDEHMALAETKRKN